MKGTNIKILAVVAIALILIVRFLIWIWWTPSLGPWFSYITVSIGFLFVVGIVYYFVKHLITVKTYILYGCVLLTAFYVIIGIKGFFAPFNVEVFDARDGTMKLAYCPVCEEEGRNPWHNYRHWVRANDRFCPHDGYELIIDPEEFRRQRKRLTTSSPMRRLFGVEVKIEVPARSNQVSSGIVVKQGETLRVSASGDIVWDPKVTFGKVGPNGAGYNPSQLQNSGGFDDMHSPCGSLLAKIGPSGKYFFVGEERKFIADHDGELFFVVNDRHPHRGDNRHEFEVEITRL